MPIYTQKCTQEACGAIFEDIRAISHIDPNPACRTCGAATTREWSAATASGTCDPVLVFQAPDGSFRFPGMGEGRSIAHYRALGYQRHEIRGAADMRRFEGLMNRREMSIMSRKVEIKQRMREARESLTRSELRSRMASMSRFGRDLAREAMRHNDHKPRERTPDAGFHSEVFSFNRSNREESRDSHGRRHRD